MIVLTATGKRLTATSDQPITSGSVGLTATLSTDAAWAGLTITVVFRVGTTEKIATLSNGVYTVPWELLADANVGKDLQAGICGMSGTDIVYPTIYAYVGMIREGADPTADPGATPTPSAYQEILDAATNAEGVAQSVRTDADNGVFKGDKGDAGSQGPQGIQGPQGETGAAGPAGPNEITTATDASITGIIKGADGKAAQAIAGTDYADPTKMFYPNSIYGGIIATNLNTLAVSGFYTCYGTATGVPNTSSSWYIVHVNSNSGTDYGFQIAKAYGAATGLYYRVKSTGTWSAWGLCPATDIGISDTGGYFAGTTVEAALAEVGSELNGLATALEALL